MLDSRPVIAITPIIEKDGFFYTRSEYVDSVAKSGGIPLMIPYVEDLTILKNIIEKCDGVLFSGGFDIDPSRYNQVKKQTCGQVSLMRDRLDFNLLDIALGLDKPILAICRGTQLINVFQGGTLLQDIPTEINSMLIHRQDEPHDIPSHEVEIIDNTPLSNLLNEKNIPVNSLHHQCVDKIGKDLKVMAKSPDGVVEALYFPSKRYVRCYQWHPERSFISDERSRKIFKDFINNCR